MRARSSRLQPFVSSLALALVTAVLVALLLRVSAQNVTLDLTSRVGREKR